MFYRCLLSVFLLAPLTGLAGCGPSGGTRVLDGDVELDPDVGSEVNDPAAMEEMMNADPTPPS